MIWTNDILNRAYHMVREHGYVAAAEQISNELEEYIHPEQLRGAIRRWNARQQIEQRRNTAMHTNTRHDTTCDTGAHEQHRIPYIVDTLPRNGTITLGALGDTHYGSTSERQDLVEELYDIYANEGVTKVFHTGNYIEGEASFNKHDVRVHGMDNQLHYFVRNYPQRDNITTYYISGDDHDGWYTQREGIDVGERLEDIARRYGRNDLVYLGYMECDVPIARNYDRVARVIHPGGGSAQAVSWTSQKLIASVEHEDVMPLLFFVGHYHKAEFLPNYRGAYVFQTGTFQEQSRFMRKKLLRADIGAWLVRLTVEDYTITRIGGEFITFKHRQRRNWKYTLNYIR